MVIFQEILTSATTSSKCYLKYKFIHLLPLKRYYDLVSVLLGGGAAGFMNYHSVDMCTIGESE